MGGQQGLKIGFLNNGHILSPFDHHLLTGVELRAAKCAAPVSAPEPEGNSKSQLPVTCFFFRHVV